MSLSRHRLRTPSPDRRRKERVRFGCSYRCCWCAGPTRANFCATKFISFVAFEQLNRPNPLFRRRRGRAQPVRGPVEGLVPGGRAQHAVVADHRLGESGEWLSHPLHHLLSFTESYPDGHSRPLVARNSARSLSDGGASGIFQAASPPLCAALGLEIPEEPFPHTGIRRPSSARRAVWSEGPSGYDSVNERR